MTGLSGPPAPAHPTSEAANVATTMAVTTVRSDREPLGIIAFLPFFDQPSSALFGATRRS
jgi:hypothetical protein